MKYSEAKSVINLMRTYSAHTAMGMPDHKAKRSILRMMETISKERGKAEPSMLCNTPEKVQAFIQKSEEDRTKNIPTNTNGGADEPFKCRGKDERHAELLDKQWERENEDR